MKALVTGATGFLGGAVARRLHADGWAVTATGRNVEKGSILKQEGLYFVPADLGEAQAIVPLCAKQDVVFHCGALSAPWGKRADFERANVQGTQHILDGCRQYHVGRLVHVSTPSLYFYNNAGLNVAETADLATKDINFYVATKRIAEQLVQDEIRRGLPAIVTRPRAIFGPGDTTIFPRLLTAMKTGRLPIIGDGENVADLSYIDNVVDALLLCGTADAAYNGRTYNITNGEPIKLWALINGLCDSLGYPKPSRHVSVATLLLIATVIESFFKLARPNAEPPITRYTVGVLGQNRTLDISAIQHDLGYEPRISIDEGKELFLAWWRSTHETDKQQSG